MCLSLKNGSIDPKMLDAKFGWNEHIGFKEYDVFKRRQCILTFLLLSPLALVRTDLKTWVEIGRVNQEMEYMYIFFVS